MSRSSQLLFDILDVRAASLEFFFMSFVEGVDDVQRNRICEYSLRKLLITSYGFRLSILLPLLLPSPSFRSDNHHFRQYLIPSLAHHTDDISIPTGSGIFALCSPFS
jgi:hypothetical protein